MSARLLAIIATVGMCAIVFAYSLPAFFPAAKPVWLFEGAYAEYEGEATFLSIPVAMKARLEVLDFNSTHVEMSGRFIYEVLGFRNETTYGPTWVPLEDSPHPLNVTPIEVYSGEAYIEGLGVRECRVYVFEQDGLEMRLYIDDQIGFPIRISVDLGILPLSIELELVESNIPGLEGVSR